ncbi:hypothetical protein IE53DRAFT_346123 [Violaceomyces palustris]|uniref:Uncharacterized protein n=1 Tax=Violaceomyces palustris TaxID=1673888 RepID=A0ACD0NTZ2_9BASI|nr:hypothetical protein IE53DRAFT_346123 [Violaceomyces palustris]
MAGPSSSSSSKMEKRGNMERGKGNKGTIKEQGRALTHQEIWDDTALINAWQAAEDEYKLFHSRRLKASSLQADPANHEYIHRPGSETTTATESMQNLIMAWYYAGYYTALHQGFSNHPQP